MATFNLETNQYDVDLEYGGFSPNLENSPVKPNLETSPNGNEYFPQKKQAANKNSAAKKEKTKKQFSKMLAASTTLAVTVTAIATSATPPPTTEPLLPPQNAYVSAEIADYRPSYYIEGGDLTDSADDTLVPTEYDVAFTFSAPNGQIESVTISGAAYQSRYNYDADTVAIDETIPKEALKISEDGQVTAIYTVSDIYSRHELNPVLNYYQVHPDTGENELKTVEGELFVADLSFLYFTETSSTNKITEVIDGNTVKCTLTFNEFNQGCFDFKVEGLDVYCGDQAVVSLSLENQPEKLPKLENGTIAYYFEFEKPAGESVVVSAEIFGDCYLNGEKINEISSSSVAKEIIWGEAYSLEKVSFDSELESMSVNGLTLKSAKYYLPYVGEVDAVEKMLPGTTVSLYFILEGSALERGTISINLTVNDELITDLDLTYASEMDVYAGDIDAYLEVTFTMPYQNVTSSDIAVLGFTFTPTP